ncbi:hypothetical protein R1flu_011597 [Riccia fluitans]|uniref:CHCH domain-containing protein n=1 Tax=Riccia fluitans TaxID=41844 RepID=A0ABD1Z884_9MARC
MFLFCWAFVNTEKEKLRKADSKSLRKMEGMTTTTATAAFPETKDSAPRKSIQKLSESFCAPQYAASLKCLDDSDYDKSKCQDHFEAYKACREQERKIRLEANRKSKRFF